MNTNKKQNQTLSPAEKSIQALNCSGAQVLSLLACSKLHPWSLEPSRVPWEVLLLNPQGSTNVPMGRDTTTEGSISQAGQAAHNAQWQVLTSAEPMALCSNSIAAYVWHTHTWDSEATHLPSRSVDEVSWVIYQFQRYICI